MNLVHAIGLGMFVLILVYLGLQNPGGVASIFNSGFGGVNNLTKTLQGR